jgi:hypothetical protein
MISRWPQELVEKAKKPAEVALAEVLAKQFEPQITKAVFAYLEGQAGVPLQTLIDALMSGDAGKVLQAISAAGAITPTAPIKTGLQDALWAAGVATVSNLAPPGTTPPVVRAEFHFDRVNPTLVGWLQSYELDLIKQIDGGTRESIRDILVEQMLKGDGPQKAASRIKEVIGLTKRQANAVGAYRKELETFHLKRSADGWKLGSKVDMVNGHPVFRIGPDGDPMDGVMERRLRDFRYDRQLIRAIETRKPLKPEQIDKMVAAYARKYRMYRARNIARTESLRATNVGVQEAYRQAIAKGVIAEDVVRRFWIVGKDERTCAVCAPIPKMNEGGVKFAQPFATPAGPVMMGPIHPQCRCSIFIRWVVPSFKKAA